MLGNYLNRLTSVENSPKQFPNHLSPPVHQSSLGPEEQQLPLGHPEQQSPLGPPAHQPPLGLPVQHSSLDPPEKQLSPLGLSEQQSPLGLPEQQQSLLGLSENQLLLGPLGNTDVDEEEMDSGDDENGNDNSADKFLSKSKKSKTFNIIVNNCSNGYACKSKNITGICSLLFNLYYYLYRRIVNRMGELFNVWRYQVLF